MNGRDLTESPEYAERLARLQGVWWKRLLDVQAPYRWNLRRLCPGFTLDVGCGIGRNLEHLRGGGVGVDHNEECVRFARARGLRAFTPDEFETSEHARAGTFDSLLLSHVIEHMTREQAVGVVGSYLPYVRPGGKVILIAPQERGHASDATHVEFMDFDALAEIGRQLGLHAEKAYSFPFPRWMGRPFIYNEFVWVGRVGEDGE